MLIDSFFRNVCVTVALLPDRVMTTFNILKAIQSCFFQRLMCFNRHNYCSSRRRDDEPAKPVPLTADKPQLLLDGADVRPGPMGERTTHGRCT